jgi:hypothetical protein
VIADQEKAKNLLPQMNADKRRSEKPSPRRHGDTEKKLPQLPRTPRLKSQAFTAINADGRGSGKSKNLLPQFWS